MRTVHRVTSRRSFLRLAGAGLAGLAVGCTDKGGETGDETGETGDTGTPDSGGGETGETGAETGHTGETGADTGTLPEVCNPTSERGQGPYYREGAPLRDDFNPLGEEGTPLRIYGYVKDGTCAPLAGVTIDVWHADQDGAYDMDSDDYRFRGRVVSDADGYYEFTTLYPPPYPGDDGLLLARHVHYMVYADGYTTVITQLKFEEDEHLDEPADSPVVMALADDGSGGYAVQFDLVLVPSPGGGTGGDTGS